MKMRSTSVLKLKFKLEMLCLATLSETYYKSKKFRQVYCRLFTFNNTVLCLFRHCNWRQITKLEHVTWTLDSRREGATE